MISGRFFVEQEYCAMARLVEEFPQSFPYAVEKLRMIKGKIICSGVGKSAYVAQKASATFSSTGTASFFIHPTDALHGDLGAMGKEDALLLFSNSGETLELLKLTRHSPSSLHIVITSHEKSSLASSSHIVLTLPFVKEACPLGLAPTTSILFMMSIADALALTLSSLKGFTKEDYHRLHPEGTLGKSLLKVSHVMRTPPPLLQRESASCEQVLAMMIRQRVDCIGLMDKHHQLVAMIIQDDLDALLQGFLPVHPSPPSISPSCSLDEALLRMEENHCSFLFVGEKEEEIQGLLCKEDIQRGHVYG